MKFIKGDNEDLLWEFFRYNITDCFEGMDLVDYSKQNFFEKFFSKGGTLKKDIEITIKINGEKADINAWRK